MGKSYRDLVAWQKAMKLVSQVYDDTEHFPDRERFGLTSQIRRAAVSIPCNIAEGQGRRTKKEFSSVSWERTRFGHGGRNPGLDST